MSQIVATFTPLGGAATYTGPTMLTDRYDTIAGTVFSDQAGTIHIQQSPDGTNWDLDTFYAITASTGKGFSETIVAPYYRITYVNGATPQTAFRLKASAEATGYAT